MGYSEQLVLYSDGGAELNVSGGSACIVEDTASKKRIKLAAYIGKSTNNEAEIVAGLLGYSFVRAYAERGEATVDTVRWVCDSQYVLNSATQYINNWQRNGWKTSKKEPVKNQGLWRAYLELSQGPTITPEFVRGHTGHPENESCDSAASWLIACGKMFVKESGGPALTTIESDHDAQPWGVIDGRPFLDALRAGDDPDRDLFLGVVELFVECGWDSFELSGDVITSGSQEHAKASDKTTSVRDVLRALKRAKSLSRALGESELESEIAELIERFDG